MNYYQWRHQNFLWGGIKGAKIQKFCKKWLILPIFSSKGGGEPPAGGKCPLDAATDYYIIDNCYQNYLCKPILVLILHN